MKPVNSAAFKTAVFQFSVFFSLLTIVTALSIVFVLQTGRTGINILEEQHHSYTKLFIQQSKIANDLDQLIRYLYQLKNKNRTASQHKKLQIITSELKDKIKLEIKKNQPSLQNLGLGQAKLPSQLSRLQQLEDQAKKVTGNTNIYLEMLNVVVVIQKLLDQIKENQENHLHQSELLDKCIAQYTRNL